MSQNVRYPLPFPRPTGLGAGVIITPPTPDQAGAPPAYISDQTRMRIRRGFVPRRGRFFEPPWIQGPQNVWTPFQIEKATRRPPRARRTGRYFEPPWIQGEQTVWRPDPIRQPGVHPRWLPSKRANYFEPPFPQGPQNVWGPFEFVQASRRAPSLRRWGQYFEPPWPAPVIAFTPGFVGKRRPPRLRRTGRYFEPPWAQGPQNVWTPFRFTQATRRAPSRPTRRGEFFQPPWAAFVTPPAPIYVRASWRRLPVLCRRGKQFSPPWPQGPQNAWTPFDDVKATRRAPSRPTRRGDYFQPPWPAPITPQAPIYMRASWRRLPVLCRRTKFHQPPWTQGPQNAWTPSTSIPRQSRRPSYRTPRGRFFQPPWAAPIVAICPNMLTQRRRAIPARPRRGRFIEPPWVEGPQSIWRSPWRRRTGAWPRFAAYLRRGMYCEPPFELPTQVWATAEVDQTGVSGNVDPGGTSGNVDPGGGQGSVDQGGATGTVTIEVVEGEAEIL